MKQLEEVEKDYAITVFEEVTDILNNKDYTKEKMLYEIDDCIRSIKLTTNDELNEMEMKHKEYYKKYGKDDIKTRTINHKINNEINKIYNPK